MRAFFANYADDVGVIPVAGEGGAIDFGFYSLEGSDATYLYCFCLTDIYGEIQLSDFISFEL